MKIHGLAIAGLVLAALTGALYWSNHHKPADTTAASADTPPKILTLNEAGISKIGLKRRGADQVVVAKDGSGKWQILAPKSFAADQSAVSGIVSILASLNSERLVEEKAGHLSQYGLSEPLLEAEVTEKENRTKKLLIGDDTPTGNAVYAKLEGDPRIFTIASYNKNSIDKTSNDLRDKKLLAVNPDRISKLELVASKRGLEFVRNKDQWQIVKPGPLRADSSRVEDLVRALTDAKMELDGSSSGSGDAQKITSAFASSTPVATAKVTDESGTQELVVRKKKDDYYAQSSVVDGVYKVSSVLGQGLDKDLDDFRNKKLFDFGFNDPLKIEIHDGSKAHFLTRNGQDWWSGEGKKMDIMSVQPLVEKVRDLSASKFVDSGYSTPAIELAVTSNDGNRLEHVLVSKNGEQWVAKRESEPGLYELDSKAVVELEKAADDLKPASAPSK
jgi:Domain of unknown function (DUF4340)